MSDHFRRLKLLKHSGGTSEPASWEKAIAVHKTETPGQYKATCYPDWSYGNAMQGGLLVCLAVEAAKIHCKGEKPEANLIDAVSGQTTFLLPARPGSVDIKVHSLKLGSQYSTFRVGLYQPDSKTEGHRQCIESTITLGNLDKESSNPSALKLPPSDRPINTEASKKKPSREGWIPVKMTTTGAPFYAHKKNFTSMYPPNTIFDGDTPQTHPVFGPFIRENWFKGEEPWTASHLPFLADLGRPMHSSFKPGLAYWAPTLNMSFYVKKRPPHTTHVQGKEAGSEWLFQRAQLVESNPGRYLNEITIMDEDGETVAVAHAVCIPVSFQRFAQKPEGDKDENNKPKAAETGKAASKL